jgi:shikimate kinase
MSIIAYGKRHLFLAGFMGTGKSAVGNLVARRLSRQLYDLDEMIVSMTGRSIGETFRIEGHDAFRHHETRALRSIVISAGAVIALGGGAPTTPLIADIMRRTGRTALLTAGWPAIWSRIKDDGSRPLVSPVTGDSEPEAPERFERFVARAEAILMNRQRLFQSIADHVVDTTELSCDEVADRIVAWWKTPIVEQPA